jgi:signal transduction histidine kinase
MQRRASTAVSTAPRPRPAALAPPLAARCSRSSRVSGPQGRQLADVDSQPRASRSRSTARRTCTAPRSTSPHGTRRLRCSGGWRAESARRAEIEASRARIVEAADAARRRLEGDLHDGAQQQLVVASLTLNRAAARARWTPAEALVVEALDQVRRALAEPRELASGIHPALLSDHGLPAALQGARRAAARAGGGAGARAAPSPGVEAAPYFMAAEALTNVA